MSILGVVRLVTAAIAVLTGLAGCGQSAPGPHAQAQTQRAAAPAKPTAATPLPDPNAALPRSATALAQRLADSTRRLDAAIAAWRRTAPGPAARPPRAVALLALDQQRAYRAMRGDPAFAARAIAALPPALRSSVRDNYRAGRSLFLLTPAHPPRSVKIRIGRAAAPDQLLGYYREAEARFGVSRWILAAVNLVESDYNRLRNASYAGARGPMQFMPATWSGYGMGGSIDDPHDAILGAANYLHSSGAPGNYHRAIYAYNNSALYVDAILRYARQMQRDPQRFYAYWSWQVFVHSARGYKRLTGPESTAAGIPSP